MAGSLAGKFAIVFGGSSGIGLSTVLKLAERGARVQAVSRNPEKAATRLAEAGVTLPENVSLKQCDACDAKAVAEFFEASEPVDILISSATGGSRAFGPFLEMDLDGFKGSFDKLFGYATVVRFGAPKLTEHGNIVIVSGAPARDAKPGQIALSAVGAAVEAFARSIAKEIAPRRINVVSPGLIDTPMFAQEGAERDEFFAKLTSSHLIPRRGRPEEVADGILFAVENGFVTGTTIDVDGGWLLRH
eukprot:INCI16241.1.p1 GENE.INCI16241.1~~INCI16241.1.p1  ORF type:complete len:280 (+),score=51.48 INCI16241.1:103-840(+)